MSQPFSTLTPVRLEPGNATMRIKQKVHPEKNEKVDYRTSYTALACLVMATRCMSVVRGEELIKIQNDRNDKLIIRINEL